jgi:molybdopterin/thiamine biosynthesis adenylyltransferase
MCVPMHMRCSTASTISLRCLRAIAPVSAQADCVAEAFRYATAGVFALLTGIIGSLQTTEALKLLVGVEHGLSGRQLGSIAQDMSGTL